MSATNLGPVRRRAIAALVLLTAFTPAVDRSPSREAHPHSTDAKNHWCEL
jgi:hypothetical protein